ncbi:TetR/AcrR family transcriptional regulator [Nocardia cyriacigeorgica]|uniref:TetR/AcrR family transcriptional regulator n=1 Tax=Nocardia cyriacigeorgica TaxID=135487 RepID=UPI0024556FC2|nr:helix-turn-helix domain-containing protein [Nocardia cyriacigeorgica]
MSAVDRNPRRRRNPAQTRQAIIDALLEQLKAGVAAPTTKAIAAGARTSERSIFVHFPERDEMLAAATDQQSAHVETLITSVDPQQPLSERIDAMVTQSAAIFDVQRFPRPLGLVESRNIPAIDERMRLTDRRMRDSIGHAFAPELARAADPDALLDLLDATLAWPVRHHLVERAGLTRSAASSRVGRMLRALITAETSTDD